MIIREWRATVSRGNESRYLELARRLALPHLAGVEGYRGGFFTRRETGSDRVEYLVLTFWESIESLKNLTGGRPESAFVPEEIRILLLEADRTATHYQGVIEHETGRLVNPASKTE